MTLTTGSGFSADVPKSKFMISEAFEAPVSEEVCPKLGCLNSALGSGYALELTLEALGDLLRFLSCRVRKKYRAMGATRAITAIGTTIAGMRVLRGVPLGGLDDGWAGADVCTDAGGGTVEDAEIVVNVAKAREDIVAVASCPVGAKMVGGRLEPGGRSLGLWRFWRRRILIRIVVVLDRRSQPRFRQKA